VAKVILIRHGQSEANVNQEILFAIEDALVPLTAEGRNQANAAGMKLAEVLSGDEKARVYVSSYVRTVQTWEALRIHLGGSVSGEVYTGDIVEHKMNVIDPRNHELFLGRRLRKNDLDTPYFGGESLRDVYRRALSFYNNYIKYSNEAVVIVSHGRFMQMLRIVILGLDVSEYHTKMYQNAEFEIFTDNE
jgi:broad specificity phosphatase PhoE